MARPRQPIELIKAKGKSHKTKAEIEQRKKTELKVDLKNIEAPKCLTSRQKEEFKNIADKLLEIGIMTELDEDCLARYILAKTNYLRLTKMVNKVTRENNIVAMEKLITMQDKAFKQCRSCATDLGLTITSRCRLVVPEKEKEPKENKFNKFIV